MGIVSSSDNKVATYALMDKIDFPRERYRLGHTLVFFRAGALAFLEEKRDDIVLRLLRNLQGEVFRRIRGQVYQKKFDQRELIKVGQRQFRKYMAMRDWGWFVIIQKTRPLVGRPDPNEELRMLEAKAVATYGVYKEKCDTKVRLLEENAAIEEEKKAILAQIEKEQGNLSQYHDRQAKCNSQKADLEIALTAAQQKLAQTEQNRVQATNDKKSLEAESVVIKKDIADIEIIIQKLEQEKTSRDHTIKTLNDEIANQDEIINKLNKEKKHISESGAKSAEDLQGASEKVDHLERIKQKLEGELKMAQETVADIERTKKELEAAIMRKDTEIGGLVSKLDDEQSLVGKVQKSVKELQGRIEEMEEELEAERQARAKAERQRSDLAREMESLGERLNEATGTTHAQIELNKKRESEVTKLRKDLEECRS